MKSAKDLLEEQQKELFDRHKYVSKEFQDFGYRLALKLNDLEHKSLYIKLAKEEDRGTLERALSFASDYPNVRNKAKVFMWKMKELKEEQKKVQKIRDSDTGNSDMPGNPDSDTTPQTSDRTNSDA